MPAEKIGDALKSITENTTVSFTLLFMLGGALVAGYQKVLTVEFKADSIAQAEARLETRVTDVERSKDDISQIKTDLAVIKTNIETLKNIQQGKK